MIKVLHIVGVMNRAGLETFVMNMYRNINKDMFSFDFLCLIPQKGDYDDEITSLGGKIYYAPIEQIGGFIRHIKNYKFLRTVLGNFKDNYDVVHIHNYHAFDSYIQAKAAVDSGFINIIVHSHSTSAEFHKGLHYVFRPLLNRLHIEKLACSKAAGKWLFGKDNIKVISNGIDVSKYKFDPKVRSLYRKEFGIDNCFVIGHVGRFEPVKNQIFLCKILPDIQKKIPNAVVVFIGDGIEINVVKKYCDDNNIKGVLFLGARSDVNNMYQAFDVFAFPSFFEGIPLSIIESETSGLPCVVSTGVPSGIDIVDNVFHLSLENPLEWIDKLSDLIKLDYDRSTNYEQIIEHGYDINQSCRKLENFYLKISKG